MAVVSTPKVMAVIHYQDDDQAHSNAEIAARAGCAGVFVIHMDGHDDLIDRASLSIKQRHPEMLVGTNRLSTYPAEAVRRNVDLGLDATWSDAPGASSRGRGPHADSIRQALAETMNAHLFFGSVAFKYQAAEPDPARAAEIAAGLGWIATTSGAATGVAPETAKLRKMKHALGSRPLAVASGITPDNVGELLPYLDWILVATGVSASFYHFDPDLFRQLQASIRHAAAQTTTEATA